MIVRLAERGATKAAVVATPAARPMSTNQILLRNMSALLVRRGGRRRLAQRGLDAQVGRLRSDLDRLFVDPPPVAPDLERGLALGDVRDLEPALLVRGGEERRGHHDDGRD